MSLEKPPKIAHILQYNGVIMNELDPALLDYLIRNRGKEYTDV